MSTREAIHRREILPRIAEASTTRAQVVSVVRRDAMARPREESFDEHWLTARAPREPLLQRTTIPRAARDLFCVIATRSACANRATPTPRCRLPLSERTRPASRRRENLSASSLHSFLARLSLFERVAGRQPVALETRLERLVCFRDVSPRAHTVLTLRFRIDRVQRNVVAA